MDFDFFELRQRNCSTPPQADAVELFGQGLAAGPRPHIDTELSRIVRLRWLGRRPALRIPLPRRPGPIRWSDFPVPVVSLDKDTRFPGRHRIPRHHRLTSDLLWDRSSGRDCTSARVGRCLRELAFHPQTSRRRIRCIPSSYVCTPLTVPASGPSSSCKAISPLQIMAERAFIF
jgi:hypothetical protein